MDIRLLQTFLLVAKIGNVTQAAEQLNFSQPTVTAQIRALEEHFEVLLFERVGKKLYITEAGLRLIAYAEKLLLLYGEARATVQEFSHDRTIKVGLGTAVAAHTLSPILREFQERVPNVSVSIEHCFNIPITVKGILDNSFDLALVHDKISNSRILQFNVVAEKLLWVTHASLLDTYGDTLRQQPFIALKQGSVYREKYNPYLRQNAVIPILEYSDSEAVRQAVLNGLGIGVLPEVLVRSHIEDGTLHEFCDAPKLEIDFSVIFHKDKTFTLAMRTLLMAIAEHANINGGLSEYVSSM
ncbi:MULTISPECIES: LysR family transcriptional regulator [Pelosinus]|uniref:LysR substrate-binding protein n=1 Tax=Pelosinus fermentans B4 TaxID=1149862 RepID=I9LBF8_9FIRM|nr:MULTISPECIES: LysR family transcriptional regulator [Pelosinus]EIW17764.1 LysR substrate-binding protein [Pelosinus fermentans B4]EIW23726.1 transcriptional regulator, LysR family [Pelosinus fermentans A11]OAM94649.1 transcriptional regulator, LysR family [Pelosinus fermentans DSM 17108]SDR14509.1 DNA-binding transcriptional regulator, LysR family [Pelosinus fermentans]